MTEKLNGLDIRQAAALCFHKSRESLQSLTDISTPQLSLEAVQCSATQVG